MKIKLDNAYNVVKKLYLQISISEFKDQELLLESANVIVDLSGEILELIKTQNKLFGIAEKAVETIDASAIPKITDLVTEMTKILFIQKALKNKQSNAGKYRHSETEIHKTLNIIQNEYQSRYDTNQKWFKLNGRLKEFYQEMENQHLIDIDKIKARITRYRRKKGHSKPKR